jgi:hypothetical protein
MNLSRQATTDTRAGHGEIPQRAFDMGESAMHQIPIPVHRVAIFIKCNLK